MRGTPEHDLQRLAARFEEKFVPEPNSGCWLWLAACNKDRYGRNSYGVIGWGERGAVILAHRAAWLLYRGELLSGRDIDLRHRCDNRLCVNPDHLVIGSRLENMRDAIERGRTFGGTARAELSTALWEKNYPKWTAARPRGSAHHNTKFDEAVASEIRQSKEMTSVLAARFSVAHSTIRRIRSGKTWRAVTL